MKTRQATKWVTTLLTLLEIYACSPSNQPIPTLTSLPITASQTPQQTLTLAPPTDTSTPAPLACLAQQGRVDAGKLESTNPAQEYLIYLPPCYDEKTEERYPVLYLLHGQTYTQDQWIRLGAVDVIDNLILSGESVPFIVLFPDDRYWNLPPGPGFGQRLVDDLIPYIDQNYRTLSDKDHRAIGGMSRGAGWALRLGLTRWDLFSSIGLHSLAVLQKDSSKIGDWLTDIPPTSRPRVFMDIGDNDPELITAGQVETQFNEYGLLHEWHLYNGAHTEEYWAAHVEEYIRWYAEGWNNP
ncbi:MAG: esterase family protein [Anaerolineae bacterium]|nr:esterase family protein [Anaerolineae bacterium]MCI0607559.1 esterase family protein [Anaerolineae bacterium]